MEISAASRVVSPDGKIGPRGRTVDREAAKGRRTLEISCATADGEAQAALAAAGRVVSRSFGEKQAVLTVELTPGAEQRLRRWSESSGGRMTFERSKA